VLKRYVPYVLSVSLLIPAIRVASAQAINGSVIGNVTDSSDAVIVGAAITLTNRDTGQSRQTLTTGVGGYNFATVPPGTYEIKVVKSGFATHVQSGITVNADNVSRVDVTLKVGAVAETIRVEASAAVLQTDSAEVRHELDTRRLNNLPLPAGRNYQNLLSTVPGFSPPTNSHSVPTNPSRALFFNVNGGDPYQNSTRVDGATTLNVWLPDIVAIVPTLESIETVNVSTNSMDAETGFTGGGAISVQTKSGTNHLHGSAFEDYTGNALKARPFFLPSNQDKGKLVYHEFGGSLGGPIVKDKLFYFMSYEGTRDHEYAQVLVTVPTAAIKSGDMSGSSTPIYDPRTGTAAGANRTPFPGNVIPSDRIHPITLKLSNMLPLPNVPGSGLTNNYSGSGGYTFRRERADTKLSWNPISKLTTFGRFSMLDYESNDPPVFGAIGGININNQGGDPGISVGTTKSLTVGATYLLGPKLVLDGYFAWENDNTQTEPDVTGQNLGQQLGIPGSNGPNRYQSGWPWFIVTNYAAFGTANTAGGGDPYYRYNWQYQELVNLSWIKGRHDLRVGTEIQQQYIDNIQPSSAQGSFTFGGGPTQTSGGPSGNQYNTYATFLLGLVTTASTSVVLANPPHEPINQHWYSWYVRDRWTVSPKLTVSLGLRWDYFGFPNARTRGIATYDIASNQVKICGAGQVPSTCGVSMPKRMFSPRIGVAYRLSNSFVLRAGYGINQAPFSLGRSVLGNYPTTVSPSYPAPNSLSWYGPIDQGIPATPLPGLSTGLIPAPNNVTMSVLPQHWQWPYTQSWNFTLQKELKLGFTAQAGYVGNRLLHAMTTQFGSTLNLNAGQFPGQGQNGQPFFLSQGRTSNVNLLTPRGTTQYNALQTTLSRRFAQGLQLTANYTWSKAETPNFPTDALLYQYVASRPVQQYDRTHVLTLSGAWEPPFGRRKAVLRGWTVNGLAVFYSGLPFSVTASGTSLNMPGASQQADQVKRDVQILGSVGGAYFDPLAFAPVTTARFGNAAAYSMRGPGEVNLDLGLSRVFAVKEKFRIQFRAEAFNFTNTPHFANPGGNVSNLVKNADGSVRDLAGYAQIQSVANTGRDGIDERQFRFMLRFSF
jgi:hypothetical protein